MEETTTGWQRSSYCATGTCVEVARFGGVVQLRDGKNPDRPAVGFTVSEWNGFQDWIVAHGKSF
ncbi:DUF397 domain-containing protein [Actinoplanes xinjiangensis]|jgi:hypothetical protein|uniref:DUF397 domain-containing protein n=1 Tax=Actinoplanes xinjiangensis TaxID=512350 RepID=UPI00341655AF